MNNNEEFLEQEPAFPPEAYAPMHEWLTGFDNYNLVPPVYLEKPFSSSQVDELRNIIMWHKSLKPTERRNVPGHEEVVDMDVRVPRKMTELSRQIIDFVMPKSIEQTIDSFIKPMYKDDIRLSHYNYLDYNIAYGDNRFVPSLQPHIDASNALLTFNYMIGGNIDWDICVEDTCYKLSPGDAIVFSAVNQVHWRPKRNWKPGEYVEIISLNYSPLDDWVFTGKKDPIDPFTRVKERRQHGTDFQSTMEYAIAYEKYQLDGLRDGIPLDMWGYITDSDGNITDAPVNSTSINVPPLDFLFERARSDENPKNRKKD